MFSFTYSSTKLGEALVPGAVHGPKNGELKIQGYGSDIDKNPAADELGWRESGRRLWTDGGEGQWEKGCRMWVHGLNRDLDVIHILS